MLLPDDVAVAIPIHKPSVHDCKVTSKDVSKEPVGNQEETLGDKFVSPILFLYLCLRIFVPSLCKLNCMF